MNEFRQPAFFVSFLFFLLLLPFFAARADVAITATETATVDLEARNTGTSRNATVSSTGFVDVTANPAVYNSGLWASADGWSVTVFPGGQVKGNTFGVLFNSEPDCCGLSRSGSLFNAGAISATSATGDADGVNIGGERAVINNSGTIASVVTSAAAAATGVDMSGATSTLTNAGTITADAPSSNTLAFGVMVGGDINTLSNSGTIKAAVTLETSGAYGVTVVGTTNAVDNSGMIASTAPASNSLTVALAMVGVTNALTNSGTITSVATAENDESTAVVMLGDTNTIINSGAITANGAYEGCGVYLNGAYNTLTNTGTITGSGSGVDAWGFGVHIDTGSTNTVANQGMITASAPGSDNNKAIGVYFEDSSDANTLANSGTIAAAATGPTSTVIGVWMASDESNTFANSGTITASSDDFAAGAFFVGNVHTAINSGTITASTSAAGSVAYGIMMNGDANTVTNSGTITAAGSQTGSDAYGVAMFGNTGMVTNSGTITASADDEATGAFFIGNVNTAINSGTMAASTLAADSRANGIFMIGNANTVTNSGTITVAGPQAGLEAAGVAMLGMITNTVTNSGTITVAGPIGASGVVMSGETNTLSNSGTITAAGPTTASLAYGASMDGTTNTITNSGMISGNIGISIMDGNTTIDNSGTISGAGGTAIKLANDTNTVTLRTGSRINGIIDGSAGAGDGLELNGAGTLSASQIVNFENLRKTGAGLWTVAAGTAPLTISNTTSIDAGTLAVGGNVTTASYSQSAGSSLGLVTTPAASATITATGTATLNGGNVLVIPAAGFYARNTDYGVVFSAGAITGTFGGVSSMSPFLAPVLTAGANNYSLSLGRDYTLSAVTPNQIVVANILNHYADTMAGISSGSELAALMLISGRAEAQVALDQLVGLSHTAFAGICFSSFNQYLNTLASRMGSLATGGPSTAYNGYNGRILLASRNDTMTDAGNTLLTLSSLRDDSESTSWGFWLKGYGNLGEMSGDDRSSKYHYNTGGITGGFDKKISPNLLAGLSVGYARTQANLDDLSENATISSWQGSLYGAFLSGPWYVNGILAYGHNHNATERNISFGGIARRATADYAGHALAAFVEAGYVMTINTVSVIPMASFQAGTLIQDGFTEQEAGAFNLTVDKERTSSYLSGLGVKASKNFIVKTATLTPEVRMKWLHEFSDDDYMINAAFAGAPASTFTVRGGKPGRDTIDLGLGVTCQVQENVHLFLAYDANFARDRLEQGGSLGLRYRW